MTDAGGLISLGGDPTYDHGVEVYREAGQSLPRDVTSGAVASLIPEPKSMILVGIGILGFCPSAGGDVVANPSRRPRRRKRSSLPDGDAERRRHPGGASKGSTLPEEDRQRLPSVGWATRRRWPSIAMVGLVVDDGPGAPGPKSLIAKPG